MLTDYWLLLLTTTPRRYKVIMNVLIGRRTVSTLFWGAQYQLLPYYQTFHRLPLKQVQQLLMQLQQADLVALDTDEATVWLTDAGVARQQLLKQTLYQPHYLAIHQRLNMHQVLPVVQLALQVVSEANHQVNRYYPLSTDRQVQQTVKHWYRQVKTTDLGQVTYTSLTKSLAELPAEQAQQFVNNLTGHKQPGQTVQQLAVSGDQPEFATAVMLRDTWSLIITRFLSTTGPWQQLLAPVTRATAMSNSCEQTYRLFKTGRSLTQTAQQRRVKVNTVKEHLLEAAIWLDDFPFERVLSTKMEQSLAQRLSGPVTTWDFQQVADLAPQLDFFQFRLYQIMRSHHAN